MLPFFNSRPKSVTPYLNVLDTGKASLSNFESELRIPNVCKSNSNFKIEVRKFELRFTSLHKK